jgi:hypothetical protein
MVLSGISVLDGLDNFDGYSEYYLFSARLTAGKIGAEQTDFSVLFTMACGSAAVFEISRLWFASYS